MTDLKQLDKPLPRNGTIGIIGGGQLGRMLASSAAKLGYRVMVLEPQQDCPAAQLCNRQIIAAYDDEVALAELIEACDAITYEFENVPLSAARYIETRRPLYPPSEALRVSQDRLAEKRFLEGLGVPVAPFHPVAGAGDLAEGLEAFGESVLKTCRFGYDGKGQRVFRVGDDTSIEALNSVLDASGASGHGTPWVLEKLVAFELEFSIIGARSRRGEIALYEPAENTHENGTLRRSMVPANMLDERLATARKHVETIMSSLNYVGVIGVEFFDTADGVLVNEIAPRVHNTGHWTVEACATSQFDQHIRAITGLPLGSLERFADCEMINLLGNEIDEIASRLVDSATQVTLYGKLEARRGRKMGHVTRLLAEADDTC